MLLYAGLGLVDRGLGLGFAGLVTSLVLVLAHHVSLEKKPLNGRRIYCSLWCNGQRAG